MTAPTDATPAPLCRDCVHCRPGEDWLKQKWLKWFFGQWAESEANSIEFARCSAVQPWPAESCQVTGKVTPPELWYCSVNRGKRNRCGPSGRLFSPKKGEGA